MTSGKSSSGKTPPKSRAADDLRALFEDELKDIYWAEKALTKALPKMAKNATSAKLVNALNDHLEVTKGHVTRLEQVFNLLGKKAQAKKCEAMDGLIKEGEEIIESTEPGAVRDAGIISAGQKTEHYEIASYGTLVAFANLLGETRSAAILQETLAEEKDADSTLTRIAESVINIDAADGDDESKDDKAGAKKKTKKHAMA